MLWSSQGTTRAPLIDKPWIHHAYPRNGWWRHNDSLEVEQGWSPDVGFMLLSWFWLDKLNAREMCQIHQMIDSALAIKGNEMVIAPVTQIPWALSKGSHLSRCVNVIGLATVITSVNLHYTVHELASLQLTWAISCNGLSCPSSYYSVMVNIISVWSYWKTMMPIASASASVASSSSPERWDRRCNLDGAPHQVLSMLLTCGNHCAPLPLQSSFMRRDW